MKPYVVIDKKVGETPLSALEAYRTQKKIGGGIPMAYAGRLDPMAGGKLLLLIGEECKVQERYHTLDKEYEFEVLFGVSSDTADVLGLLSPQCEVKDIRESKLRQICRRLTGKIVLPYPHFSSRPVQGKPLHTWKLEGRIDEIEIPKKQSTIYTLKLKKLRTFSAQEVYVYATEKIETIPPVVDERKKLGNDFRRTDVRTSWEHFMNSNNPEKEYFVATFVCVCSSGTYMRTLAEVIAKNLGTCGLAYSIKRTKIGRYTALPFGLGFWKKLYI